jgi:hypothetical protein
MKIRLISQASVIITTSDCKIWTDPWLEGKAFNNSWSLHPKPDFQEAWFDEIDYVWVSHEHPDHFHIQTLKNLPASFKERVTLLFQKKNSDKMPGAFKKLGFKTIKLLKHAELTQLTENTQVFVYQIGIMDSSLGVKNKEFSIFNLNDCEPNPKDYKIIRKKFDEDIDVLLNQFSLAGNNGSREDIPKIKTKAQNILQNMIDDHIGLNAKTTIPFASFVYFSSITNKYINQHHNTIDDVKAVFAKNLLDLKVLYINDEIDLADKEFDDSEAVKKFNEVQADFNVLPYDSYPEIPFDTLKEGFEKRRAQLLQSYPGFIINKLGKMSVFLEDSNYGISFAMSSGLFEKEDSITKDNSDLIMHSQPFHQAFNTTWGVQTLGVGAQYFIEKNQATWKWYRLITNLNNSEIYLKPKYFFSKKNIHYIYSRLRANGLSQLFFRLKKV